MARSGRSSISCASTRSSTTTGDGLEFVYLLEWPDEATMLERLEKFMADEEWEEITRVTAAKYGRLVGDIED
jgi:hypothetical protein